MTPAEVELRLIEVDRLLDEQHEPCPPSEGGCWCCCMGCDPEENDDLAPWVAGARATFWQMVHASSVTLI